MRQQAVRVDTSEMTASQLRDFNQAVEARKDEVNRKTTDLLESFPKMRELLNDNFYNCDMHVDLSRLCSVYRRTGKIDQEVAVELIEGIIEMVHKDVDETVKDVSPEQFTNPCEEL